MSDVAGGPADTAPSIETPLARVRGLGAAGHGAGHWWEERLTSISTFLLFVWLIVSLLRLPALDQDFLEFARGREQRTA